ncbi:hypothetical protein ACFLYA_01665 [Candidatus Dependentiae bacterium]
MKKRFITIPMLVSLIFNTSYPDCMTSQSCVCDDAATARQFTMLGHNVLSNLAMLLELVDKVIEKHANIIYYSQDNAALVKEIKECVEIIKQYSINILNNYCAFLESAQKILVNQIGFNLDVQDLYDALFISSGEGVFDEYICTLLLTVEYYELGLSIVFGNVVFFLIYLDLLIADVYENQSEPTKSFPFPVKFEIPPGYLGAANVTGTVAPDTDSMDDGLIGILDASFEIADSLVGARSVYHDTLKLYKWNKRLFKKNEGLFKKNCEIYKRNMEVRYTNKTEIIKEPGAYQLSRDVHGGIIINANDVTIDLNGHTIVSNSRIPVIVAPEKKNIVIKNGSIVGGNESSYNSCGILVNNEPQCVHIESLDIRFCKKDIHFEVEVN